MLGTALIVYASLTGNTKEITEVLAAEFEKLGVYTVVKEAEDTNPQEILHYDICAVASYTYGNEGNIPDEMLDFYDALPSLDLSGKVYGTLGSGEEFYGYFCKSADDFDAQFQLTEAIRGSEVVKIEGNPDENDVLSIRSFAEQMVKTMETLKSDHVKEFKA